MTRRLLNLLTTLSLVLFGVVLVIWCRSHSGADSVAFSGAASMKGSVQRSTTTAVCSLEGRLWVFRFWDAVRIDRDLDDGIAGLREAPDLEIWLSENLSNPGFPRSPQLRDRDLAPRSGTHFGRWGFGIDREVASPGRSIPYTFGVRDRLGPYSEKTLTLSAPHWSFALAAAILPTLRLGVRLYTRFWRKAHRGSGPRLLNLLTTLSLVCLGLMAWAWHRSYAGVDSMVFNGAAYDDGPVRRATTSALCSSSGRIWLFRFWNSESRDKIIEESLGNGLEVLESPDVEMWLAEDSRSLGFPSSFRLRSRNLPINANVNFGRWGFGIKRSSRNWKSLSGVGFHFSRTRHFEKRITLFAPFWPFALAASMLPALRVAARLYRATWRRARQGQCARCGYDLRATPDKCPECGTLAAGGGRAHQTKNGIAMITRTSQWAVIAICTPLVAAGCHRGHGVAHYSRTATLTPRAPENVKVGVRLLRVEPDGSAVIFVRATKETLAARPGEYFLGAYQPPYNVRTFGEHGLYLSSTDVDAQSAVLLRMGARQF